ncbi:SRR1-like protein isoform X2 [Lampetra fluviatilis]
MAGGGGGDGDGGGGGDGGGDGGGGEWRMVRRRHGKRSGVGRLPHPPHPPPHHDRPRAHETQLTCAQILRSLEMARAELEMMEFTEKCVALVRSVVEAVKMDTEGWTTQRRNHARALEVVAYGVGRFAICPTARYQLALLCIITDSLQVVRSKVSVYDPVFSAVEEQTLTSLGMSLVRYNEEGKRRVSGPTLFYLPHCGKALSNNLLWSNWDPRSLAQTILIGNSLSSVVSSLPSRILDRDYRLIHKEVALPALPPRLSDVFNDTTLHHFPPRRISPRRRLALHHTHTAVAAGGGGGGDGGWRW